MGVLKLGGTVCVDAAPLSTRNYRED
jgi:hypothetical protein